MAATAATASHIGCNHGTTFRTMFTHRTWQEELARVPELSHREVDVFRLLGEGESNRSIAARLAVTERTAKAHVAQILCKLRVESRLQAGLVSYAWIESLRTTL